MMTYGDSPMGAQTPPAWLKRIMHVTLEAGGQTLQGADAPPERYQKPQGISVALSIDNEAEEERIFAALAENGDVILPIQQTFWARRFGMMMDRFGTPWMINCGNPAA